VTGTPPRVLKFYSKKITIENRERKNVFKNRSLKKQAHILNKFPVCVKATQTFFLNIRNWRKKDFFF